MLIHRLVDQKKLTYELNVEDFRILGYGAFWLLVLIAAIISLLFASDHLHHSIFMEKVGYNNICVLFDYPPANTILPTLWAFTMSILSSYIFLNWLRVHIDRKRGVLSDKIALFSSIVSIVEMISLCFFSTVFAISPDKDIFLHTIPFTFLIVALSLLAVNNFIYFDSSMGLTKNERMIGLFYISIHIIISFIKIVGQINFLFGDFLFCAQCHAVFFQTIDRLWMITAAILPICISIAFRRRVQPLYISFSLRD